MRKFAYIFLIGGLTLAFGCNQSKSGDNRVTASDAYDLDRGHDKGVSAEEGDEVSACPHQTRIFWTGSKPTGEHTGYIKLEKGDYLVEDGELVGGEFIIDMKTIVDIDLEDEDMNSKLVGHLKSPDFFHVDSFPTAKFVITNVEDVDQDVYNKKIVGDLTIKGITKSISFLAEVKVNDDIVVAKSETFELDRTDFNVNYGSKSVFKELQDKFIHDEFSLKIEAYSM